MAYSCFWVQSDCIKPDEFTCRGCSQYPYGENHVASPSVPVDFGQQLMGVHIGLAEVLAKKGIAKPEELDEAIARSLERLGNQDKQLRDAVVGVDHVLDTMVRVSEPGKLDVYVALDEEGERQQEAVAQQVIGALDGMVPPGMEIRVMVAPTEEQQAKEKPRKKASAAKKGASKSPSAKKGGGQSTPKKGT